MKHEKTIRKAGRVALVALLALVFWFVRDIIREPEHSSTIPSGVSARIIGIVCMTVAVAAGCVAVFLLARAFYLGFTRRAATNRPEGRKRY